MSGSSIYLIVRREAFGAGLVLLTEKVGRRLVGRDMETSKDWRGTERDVLARHSKALTAYDALVRVRTKAKELQTGVDRAAREARRLREEAELQLKKEASRAA